MDGKALALSIQINHNLDEVENQLDRIFAKAERVNQLLDTQNALHKQEAFLDGQVYVVVNGPQTDLKKIIDAYKKQAMFGGHI